MRLDKLFSLKEPCKDCPFLKDGDMHASLHPARWESIIQSLHNDRPFHCHKTIDYNKETHVEQVDDAVYCAGSLLYMQKAGINNLPMRLGIAHGLLDPTALRGHEKIIDVKEK